MYLLSLVLDDVMLGGEQARDHVLPLPGLPLQALPILVADNNRQGLELLAQQVRQGTATSIAPLTASRPPCQQAAALDL